MSELNCRHFTGYKPCGLSENCTPQCSQRSLVKTRILVVHLEALGAVLRTTSILPAIVRKYPGAHITWVTQKPADQLLKNNPLIDRILTTERDDLLTLGALSFDVAFCVDKSLKASGVLKLTTSKQVFGFVVNKNGVIVPANIQAEELWQLGLSNHKKFFVNKKPETQLLVEAFNLGPFQRDPYVLGLDENEQQHVRHRRLEWSSNSEVIVGINTGCSPTIPYKKFTVEFHRHLISRMLDFPKIKIVLLGGPEDTERNSQIAYKLPVVNSLTTRGLRDGLCSVAACDLIITGDSLGMHMGIALKKWVVAWFGPTCAHEIDFYQRGEAILTRSSCSPCWRRSCHKNPMCYDLVAIDDLMQAVAKGINCLTSSSKPLLSGTSFLASP